MHQYFVYILTNKSNSVLYVGVTNDIEWRVLEHKKRINENSFTSKYNIFKLVYFEKYQNIEDAIHREKQLKKWRREWKNKIITKINSTWEDLSKNWYSKEDLL